MCVLIENGGACNKNKVQGKMLHMIYLVTIVVMRSKRKR